MPHSEYELTLTWRADADGNGIKALLKRDGEILQGSFHPTLDLHEALERAMTSFFEEGQIHNAKL